MSRAVSDRRLRPAGLAAATIALPVFLEVSGGRLRLSPAYVERVGESVTALPLSVFALPVLLVLLLARARGRALASRPGLDDLLVLGYVVVNSAALYAGVVLSGMPEPIGVMGYLQTVFPLVAYAAARLVMRPVPGESIGTSLEPAGRFLSVLGFTVSVFLLLYMAQTVIDGASSFRLSLITDHIGPFYNYKMKRFFPVYVAMATTSLAAYLLLAGRLGRARAAGIGGLLVIGVVGLLLMHSRTALLLFLVGLGVVCAGLLTVFRLTVDRRLLRLAALVALGAMLAWTPISAVGSRSLARIYETLTVVTGAQESLAAGDETRLERMTYGVEVGFGSVFGSGFRTEERHGLRRAVTTESGYLDIVARAGPLALALILALVARSVLLGVRLERRSRAGPARTGERAHWAGRAVLALLIAFAFVGNVLLNVLTEPYVGPAYWFLLGSVVSLAREPTGRRAVQTAGASASASRR